MRDGRRRDAHLGHLGWSFDQNSVRARACNATTFFRLNLHLLLPKCIILPFVLYVAYYAFISVSFSSSLIPLLSDVPPCRSLLRQACRRRRRRSCPRLTESLHPKKFVMSRQPVWWAVLALKPKPPASPRGWRWQGASKAQRRAAPAAASQPMLLPLCQQ